LTILALSEYSGSWFVSFPNDCSPVCTSLNLTFSTQEELQVPYEVKLYQRDTEYCAPEALKDIHFVGSSPVVTEGDFVLAESGAIVGDSRL
jgi:hypothetical protein